MPRLPRFAAAGVLLSAAVLLLDALLTQRSYHWAGGRFWFVWLAGSALWVAVLLLTGLPAGRFRRAGRCKLAALVFGPLWLLVCAVIAVVGVRVAGYGVAEELAVLLLNLSVPVAASVLAWRTAARRA